MNNDCSGAPIFVAHFLRCLSSLLLCGIFSFVRLHHHVLVRVRAYSTMRMMINDLCFLLARSSSSSATLSCAKVPCERRHTGAFALSSSCASCVGFLLFFFFVFVFYAIMDVCAQRERKRQGYLIASNGTVAESGYVEKYPDRFISFLAEGKQRSFLSSLFFQCPSFSCY